MRIAVIYNEPESSYYSTAGEQEAVAGVVIEAEAVKNALLELGCQVECIPLTRPVGAAVKKLERLDCDLVFNLFEGFSGFPESEADIPRFLEESGKRYTGCPPEALETALDKAGTKELLKSHGISTPDYQLLGTGDISLFNLEYPCIVKPNSEDASHGLNAESVVDDFESLYRQVSRIQADYEAKEALVEEYVEGREFNATVTGNTGGKVLEISEIEFSLPAGTPKIITYSGKWKPDSDYFIGTKPVCPAHITENRRRDISGVAEKAYELTGCRGYARIDMRMGSDGKIYVLEVNPNPDISPDSGAALQAGAAGMDYVRFIERIITLALEKAE